MSEQQPRRKTQSAKSAKDDPSITIPDKLYFRIGDVAQLCSLEAYVLRYWETEFPQLKPHKGGTGQRLYKKRDVELVLEIKRLLYTEGFTIAGARRLLADKRRTDRPEGSARASTEPLQVTRPGVVLHPGSPKSRSAIASAPDPENPNLSRSKPQFSQLRREMRELLSLLETETREFSSTPLRSKRETKKNNPPAEEPTLFELE